MNLKQRAAASAARFRITAKPIYAYYCRCSICRKISGGGMFLASATVPIEEFTFTTGSPASYESLPGNLRLFCGTCGSSVGFRVAENPKLMDFNLGSLDNPELIKPDRHLFTSSQVAWCKIDDDLP